MILSLEKHGCTQWVTRSQHFALFGLLIDISTLKLISWSVGWVTRLALRAE